VIMDLRWDTSVEAVEFPIRLKFAYCNHLAGLAVHWYDPKTLPRLAVS
jgi:hypothetical protein